MVPVNATTFASVPDAPIPLTLTAVPLIDTSSSELTVISVIVIVPPVLIVKSALLSKATPPPVNVKVWVPAFVIVCAALMSISSVLPDSVVFVVNSASPSSL